jgi:protein TonB
MQLLTSAGIVPGQRRPIGRALGLSLAVHAGLAVGLAFLPVRSPSLETPIEVTVDVLSEFLAPPPPPPAAPEPPVLQRSEAAPRPRAARPPAAAPPGASDRRTDPEPPAAVAAEEPPPAPQVAEPVESGPPEPSAVAVLPPAAGGGGAGRPAGGSGVGSPGSPGTGSGRFGVGSGSDEGNPSRRRATADRYRDELLRTRIHSVFHYPSEARELELTGRVLVTVAIHRNGQLLDVKLAGRCPHAILCADGLRTLRAAAPFPPIPSELGDSLVIEVPLTYAFE